MHSYVSRSLVDGDITGRRNGHFAANFPRVSGDEAGARLDNSVSNARYVCTVLAIRLGDMGGGNKAGIIKQAAQQGPKWGFFQKPTCRRQYECVRNE